MICTEYKRPIRMSATTAMPTERNRMRPVALDLIGERNTLASKRLFGDKKLGDGLAEAETLCLTRIQSIFARNVLQFQFAYRRFDTPNTVLQIVIQKHLRNRMQHKVQ